MQWVSRHIVVALIVAAMVVTGCDGVVSPSEVDSAPDDSLHVPQIDSPPDSIFLAFSEDYTGVNSGFYNVATGQIAGMIPARPVHPLTGKAESDVRMPMISPLGDKLAYFGGEFGRVALIEGETIEDFLSNPREDIDRRIRASSLVWSGDGSSFYYRTGVGIAGVGWSTTYIFDLESQTASILVDRFIPVGTTHRGNLLIRGVDDSRLLEFDASTGSFDQFYHPAFIGQVFHIEWSDTYRSYVYASFDGSDHRWIGVSDSLGTTIRVLVSNTDGQLAYGKPRWGREGEVFYDRFERAGDRPTRIMRYDLNSNMESVYLTARQLGFDSNTLQLSDVIRIPSMR